MNSSYVFNAETETLANLIKTQFISRTQIEGKNTGKDFKDATMKYMLKDMVLWITIHINKTAHNITVPIPFIDNGIMKIKFNEVERAVCNHFDVFNDKVITYLDAIHRIFMGDYSGISDVHPVKKSMFVQQLAYSILNDNTSIIVYNLQKVINDLVSKMPLHETDMNSWMMNNRLLFIDPKFDSLDNPADKLNYQIDKNSKYASRGWTSVGLSDGTLASKNYMLTQDLRVFTPFGLHHHNPQRNLYSTLGMKGDEYPLIRTKSMQNLMDHGISRMGWNWFTIFSDIPDTFEDQIMVDISHADKFIERERRIQLFGNVVVREGQKIKFGDILSENSDGEINRYNIRAEESTIKRIVKGNTSVGGIEKEVNNVIISFKRYLKDGTKITNTHGNKGVIRLKKLGYAIDPLTGKERKIDVIVSAKTINKRKNYGQLLELLTNNINDQNNNKFVPRFSSKSEWTKEGVGTSGKIEKIKTVMNPTVIEDNSIISKTEIAGIKEELSKHGFCNDCTYNCRTYAGDLIALGGQVFWGVIKDVEDQLWDKDRTISTNGFGIRKAGLKFSTIEFKALETRFGKDNPIIHEVLSYAQGIDYLKEYISAIESKKYQFPEGKPVKTIAELKEVDQSGGTVFTKEALFETVGDENYLSDGFILQLPVCYQTAQGHDPNHTYEGAATFNHGNTDWEQYKAIYTTDKLYVPCGKLRRSWKHGSGLYGMSEIAVLINNIISFSKRYLADPEIPHNLTLLYKSISTYFMRLAKIIGTKNGAISNYALSVRYPHSAKAVATLSNEIPMNTVQIHENMAEILNVKDGDVVIIERFPCLGNVGVRPQKVSVTSDPMCKYTIRASKNSLVSLGLDFDGDVIYSASFHTKEAKELITKEWKSPNKNCWKYIDAMNNRKGTPSVNCMTLDDYEISPFPLLTAEDQAKIVGSLTGVKAQTGPVISTAYNLMRIIENSGIEIGNDMEAAVEAFIEKAGQSIFEQKHGGTSLCDIVVDAVCTGDVKSLVEEGFEESTTKFICDIIRNKAAKFGINDLKNYHDKVRDSGSNIINRIVKKENKLYFASRSNLEACALLEHLEAPAVDLPSRIFQITMSGKYDNCERAMGKLIDDRLLSKIENDNFREIGEILFKCIDKITGADVINGVVAA